ncbi:hypothetical protein UT300005_06270 [Clostridium sp. CTA-5]
MKEIFSFGPIHIYFFGLMIVISVLVGSAFAIKHGKKRGISEDIMINLITIVVIFGVLGARLFYILFYNPLLYFSHLAEIIKINEGGLSIHGGIISAIAAGYLYSTKSKISFFKIADIIVIWIALAQGIGRIGCDVFGKSMTNIMIWGINYNGQILHPVQVYEFILDYILFIILWRRSYKQKFEGELFIIYLISFAIIRSIVEFFRINPVIWGPFSISHLLSVILIIIGLMFYKVLSKREIKYTSIYIDNKLKLTTTIVYLVALIVVSISIFYFVQS